MNFKNDNRHKDISFGQHSISLIKIQINEEPWEGSTCSESDTEHFSKVWVQNVRSSCKKNKNHSACHTITRVLEVKLYVLRQQYTNYQDTKYGSVTIKCLLMWKTQTPLLFVKVLDYHLFLVTICRKQCRALWKRALSEEVPHFDLK